LYIFLCVFYRTIFAEKYEKIGKLKGENKINFLLEYEADHDLLNPNYGNGDKLISELILDNTIILYSICYHYI
jgi:hypothetical protein